VTGHEIVGVGIRCQHFCEATGILLRRQFLHLAAGAGVLPVVSGIARATAHPTRPVRFVVAFPAGGANDIVASHVAQLRSHTMPSLPDA